MLRLRGRRASPLCTPRDIDLVVFDHGAAVDALGHLLIQPPRRTSDIGPDAVRRAETVVWRGMRFTVPPLDLQLAVTRERGLHDRVAAIEAL